MIAKKDIGRLALRPGVEDDVFVQISADVDVAQKDTRLEYLTRLAQGRRVLHIGCCDHKALIDQKIKDGTWLHGLLSRSGSDCWGVDINAEAVEYVKSLGCPNIYCCNIEEGLPEEVRNTRFDLVVLGEMVEHLDSPVGFLSALHRCFDYDYELVVTVPNAFFLENFENAVNHFERINSDHRAWYTAYTASKILSQGGYCVHDVAHVFRGAPGGYGGEDPVRKNLYRSCPALRDVLVVRASASPVVTPVRAADVPAAARDLTLDGLDGLHDWNPDEADAAERASLVKSALVSLATLSGDPFYDTKLSALTRDMQYWHDKYLQERAQIYLDKDAERDAVITEKNAVITEKNAVIAEKNAEIAARDAAVAEGAARIADLKARLAAGEAELRGVRMSWSYRFGRMATAPFRLVRKIFRRREPKQ